MSLLSSVAHFHSLLRGSYQLCGVMGGAFLSTS